VALTLADDGDRLGRHVVADESVLDRIGSGVFRACRSMGYFLFLHMIRCIAAAILLLRPVAALA
jgi:hypothetical protein